VFEGDQVLQKLFRAAVCHLGLSKRGKTNESERVDFLRDWKKRRNLNFERSELAKSVFKVFDVVQELLRFGRLRIG
jgi:hypothetical protein